MMPENLVRRSEGKEPFEVSAREGEEGAGSQAIQALEPERRRQPSKLLLGLLGVGGVVMALLALAEFPAFRRYLRIKRM